MNFWNSQFVLARAPWSDWAKRVAYVRIAGLKMRGWQGRQM